MFRLTVAAIFLVAVSAFGPVSYEENFQNSSVDVLIVQNLTEHLKQNPNIKLLQPLLRDNLGRSNIRYRLGNRINGDRLVAENSQSQQWQSPQDVTLTLTYPKSGVGMVVTYVEVLVEQSSNLGQGYVTGGGIGQRQIQVVIEASRTLYFRYNSHIYGY